MSEPREVGLVECLREVGRALRRSGGRFGSGDLAELRRMDPRRIDAAAFWKAEALFFDALLPPTGDARALQETRWAAVLVGFAELQDLHHVGRRLGAALHEAGLSEARFVRLLRADRELLIDELPTLARYLAAKGVPADWVDAARLLLGENEEVAERHRRALARDYYRETETAKA